MWWTYDPISSSTDAWKQKKYDRELIGFVPTWRVMAVANIFINIYCRTKRESGLTFFNFWLDEWIHGTQSRVLTIGVILGQGDILLSTLLGAFTTIHFGFFFVRLKIFSLFSFRFPGNKCSVLWTRLNIWGFRAILLFMWFRLVLQDANVVLVHLHIYSVSVNCVQGQKPLFYGLHHCRTLDWDGSAIACIEPYVKNKMR